MKDKFDSFSQNGQDKWVVTLFKKKTNGFFIELGAADGVNLSNTYMLEKKYDWHGLLIEPTRMFEKLKINRPNNLLENCCVSSKREKVTLFEIHDKGQTGDNLLLSFIKNESEKSQSFKAEGEWGVFKRSYEMESYPLEEILLRCNVPKVIDYFSLDVEGYEFEILKTFPFHSYTFLCIGIEAPSIELVNLLEKNKYRWISKLGEDKMFVHEYYLRTIPILSLFLKYKSKLKNYLNHIHNRLHHN